MIFLDSNILLYAISTARDEAEKRQIAQQIVLKNSYGEWGFSTQVMQEFYMNATRQSVVGAALTPALASEYLSLLLVEHPCQAMDAELVLHAHRLHQRYRIHGWDAPILAAAVRLGCTHLISEDFSHQQVYEGITVINPFLPVHNA